MIVRALKFALLGAVVAAVPWLVMYLTVTNPATGNRSWPLMMMPVFVLVGAIAGALTSVALTGIRAVSGPVSQRISLAAANPDPSNDREWENRENWSLGLFYHSKADTRILVPKRFGAGYTPNLSNTVGRMLLIVPITAALIAIFLKLRK